MNSTEGKNAGRREDPVASFEHDRPFRVIIAGGGVAGLAMAHALLRAGIDHVVLEKGDVAPDWGASISTWGHGSRILSQIGCLEALEAAALPLKLLHTRGTDGKAFSQEPFFDMMKERNGFECITMERRTFLRIVYDRLPDKSKVLTGKRVIDVEETDDGVLVKLQDGTIEQGDILIGCDGVHSRVRDLMWRNANLAVENRITSEEKRSQIVTYKSLVGVSWAVPGLGIRDMHWVCERGLSFLILTQPDKIYFFVNWKLPRKMRWPSKAKWSNEEAEAAAQSVAEIPISDSAVFGELWKNKIRGHLIGLEEGMFEHWYNGRIALVGDSVHKVTPNFALGAMCALESTAVLLNKIVAVHKTLEPGERPSKTEIGNLFHSYQEERKPRMQIALDASAFITRLQAYDGNLMHFMMRVMFPIPGQARYANQLAEFVSGSPKFDFLPVAYTLPATYGWKDESTPINTTKKKQWKIGSSVTDVTVTEMISLALLTLLFFTVFGARVENSVPVPVTFNISSL
ncbi:FAD binding domain-containing protein [Bimuria novae-zelandiae CBS 107.79]|uniref:FAD binding domain-containing protein n=1 Tax=Bimuria novae-zelandiae CBS 107.79 TaxID=1447943 RepID=A0A6A5VMZ7_9PLEO|nr:FAD binding domain-containing protein [Bimuria novae-zelandiae CBS 107.79]